MTASTAIVLRAVFLLIFLFAVVALFAGAAASALPSETDTAAECPHEESALPHYCPTQDGDPGADDVVFSGNGRDRIFDQISAEEIDAVVEYMLRQNLIDLNRWQLESYENATTLNYPTSFQLYPPTKSDAVAYLDGLSDVPPGRYARVTVFRAKKEENRNEQRDVMEYKVGPLVSSSLGEDDGNNNVVDAASISVAQPMLEDGEIPFAQRTSGSLDYQFMQDVVAYHTYKLRRLLMATTSTSTTTTTFNSTAEQQDREKGEDDVDDAVGYCYGFNATGHANGCGGTVLTNTTPIIPHAMREPLLFSSALLL